ncbi:MAG: tol-pal system protein YbgF [Thermodesulfovibrionales bacterium]
MKRFILPVFLLVLAGCVSTEEFDRMRADLNETRRDSVELRKDIESLREKTAGTVKEDSMAAVRESQANMNTRINDLASGLQELRGRFDENRYFTEKTQKEAGIEKELVRTQISGLEAQVKALREKLAQFEADALKAREAEKQPMPPTQATENAKPEAAAKEPAEPAKVAEKKEPGDAKAKIFDIASQAYKEKKYREAREGFEQFMKEEPKSSLADNAQFMVGETYYQEKDFESAILAYEALLKKYPGSDKTAAALYKQGLAFIEIGDAKTGRIILAKLVEKYPSAQEADAARKKIAELDRKPQKKK